jgi:trehalose/maltose hydrolase-like predicted phosphorylase
MGLSSAGYSGHVFWDADTWMFPALLLTHPDMARSMVMFRYRTLDAAKRNARANGFRGAKYPWEAGDSGDETTPRFAIQNAVSEIHVTGDVALAQWQYFLATGDSTWLERYGYPVIRETANFWASRATYNQTRDRYDIRNVVSVDEGLIGIANDVYTNAVAKRNLEIATAASKLLRQTGNPLWARTAAKLYVPYDSAGGYHPTYEGAPDSTRGSVSPLLSYPLEIPMSERAKRTDLAHALQQFAKRGGGAMMTTTLYPVIAAELGERSVVDTLPLHTYQPHLRGPFMVLAETPRNNAVNFLTGAGGFLQQVIYGYTGLRLQESGLTPKFKPLLPSRIKRLVLRNIQIRGKRYDVVVQGGETRLLPHERKRAPAAARPSGAEVESSTSRGAPR